MTPTTFICTAANKAAAEATGRATFGLQLSPTGAAPATHYACSGLASADDITTLTPNCVIVAQNDGAPFATFAANGLYEVAITMTH